MTTASTPPPAEPDPFANSSDPLLDEVRAARRAVMEQHGNDLGRLVESLRQLEQAWPAGIAPDGGDRAKKAG
ncbi:MAG: hypothetical protein ACKVS8_11645 [Phycisphaerales bacterium]